MTPRSTDRRASAAAPAEAPSAKGERMSEYFAPARGMKAVTRAELLSILGIVLREHERTHHLPWWTRLRLRLRLARMGRDGTGRGALTQAAVATQEAAEAVSGGKLHE